MNKHMKLNSVLVVLSAIGWAILILWYPMVFPLTELDYLLGFFVLVFSVCVMLCSAIVITFYYGRKKK